MPLEKMEELVSKELDQLRQQGTLKGEELVIERVERSEDGKAPRYRIAGKEGGFLRMNLNSYLGMHLNEEVIEAEEESSEKFGAGPGAVRFIHGTYRPHVRLEERLADFHSREDCIIYSSAYSAMCGVIQPLTSPETLIISDELNHNCIINGIRMAKPKGKAIYDHLEYDQLRDQLAGAVGEYDRVLIISDGVFSMRGDFVDVPELQGLAEQFDSEFSDGVFTLMDDSHGVGAYGETGRGTEEITGGQVDVLLATMGKAIGVNGGYVATSTRIVDYLRETSPFYIYSNPITAPEAYASRKSLDIIDSSEGREKLAHLSEMTNYFETGLQDMGQEVIRGPHPIVPLMIRDTEETTALVSHLEENHVLATAIKYPVVPQGDECIRFQISANHTEEDLDYVLGVIEEFVD